MHIPYIGETNQETITIAIVVTLWRTDVNKLDRHTVGWFLSCVT